MNAKFPLGRLVATPGAMDKLDHDDIAAAVKRHACGDWGDVDDDDKAANDRALVDGTRLFSLVMTPGKDVKCYFAACLDAQSDRVMWVRAEKKNSRPFIMMLQKLLKAYPHKKIVDVILDNYVIHSIKQTRTWLAEHGERLRLHLLPPYCPNDNRIERKIPCTYDLFRVDDEGYLSFVGRGDDITKTRGDKVNPKEVKNALYAMARIAEAAVVAVPDDVLGSTIKAVVLMAPNANLSERNI